MSKTPSSVNPHAAQPVSFSGMGSSILRNRKLIFQMARREVIGRYRGSTMGLIWSFFNPILMLVVYTFVFSEVFKSRWGPAGVEENRTQFAVVLFVGLIVLALTSELLNRSATLITSNVNFVKKVVFPLEILPVIAMAAALFHAAISFAVLLIAFFIFNGFLHWTVLLAPLVMAPLIVMLVGLGWILASLGVFLRDIGQTVVIVTSVLMFISPVFYPVTAVPTAFRGIIMANPLTFIIEQMRAVLIWGHMPDWTGLAIYLIASLAVAWVGYAWFQKTRKGFADVL